MKPLILVLLLFLATHARAQSPAAGEPDNIVFLLDVSNSMGRDDKMKMLKKI